MKHLGGRPEIKIDWKTVENACAIQCTGEEIASLLNISYDTLQRRILKVYECSFAEYYKKHSAKGKISLRRNQFRLAEKNTAMCIWLGKQYLGQKEPNMIIGEISEPPEFAGKTDEELDKMINELQKKNGNGNGNGNGK